MKGMQDTSPTVGSDTVYFTKKEPNKNDKGLLLKSGKDSYQGRNLLPAIVAHSSWNLILLNRFEF